MLSIIKESLLLNFQFRIQLMTSTFSRLLYLLDPDTGGLFKCGSGSAALVESRFLWVFLRGGV